MPCWTIGVGFEPKLDQINARLSQWSCDKRKTFSKSVASPGDSNFEGMNCKFENQKQ